MLHLKQRQLKKFLILLSFVSVKFYCTTNQPFTNAIRISFKFLFFLLYRFLIRTFVFLSLKEHNIIRKHTCKPYQNKKKSLEQKL